MPGDRTPARRQGRPAVPVGADVPSLSITDVEGEGERALVARGTAYVRAYAAVEQQPTILLKNLAVVLVTLRRCFVDSEGRPDMRGKTGEYREAAGEIYRASGLDADRQSGIQQAVRWHIGNLLRDEMSYDELLAYDLKTSSPLERLQDSREASAAIVAASRATDLATVSASAPVDVKATAAQLTLGRSVRSIVGQMSIDVITSEMTDGQRARLDEALAEAQATIAKLRRHTRKRSSGT